MGPKYTFSLYEESELNSGVPLIRIDGKTLHVRICTIMFNTKTEEAGSGSYKSLVIGYLGNELTSRIFQFDFKNKTVQELSSEDIDLDQYIISKRRKVLKWRK